MTRTASLMSIALLAACTTSSDMTSLLPDERLLIDMPTQFGGAARSIAGDTSEYQALTADATTGVNELIDDVLTGLHEITSYNPTWENGGRRAVWGPWEDGGVNGRLWMEKNADGSHSWAVDAKLATEGEDAYRGVFAGQIDAGATPDVSTGTIAVDFAALTTFDPTVGLTGGFEVAYAVDGDVVAADAAFSGFSDDLGVPADAVYHYEEDGSGFGLMDLAVLADALGTPAPELHIVRSRWDASGAGRADAYVTDGDLGPLVYTATECWNASATVVYYEENYEMVRSGEPALCAFGDAEFSESETAPVQ